MKHTLRLRTLLGSALLFCSCVGHHQYQTSDTTTLGTAKKPRSTQKVSVIEFDSNGTFWNTLQLHRALENIRSTPKPLLITFVHGWRHNARPDDDDLQQFSAFIDKLRENKGSIPGGYTPVGLYIGWRGATINEHPKSLAWLTTLPAVLSFWNIKHGTERMALRGDLSHALSQTTAAAWGKDTATGGGKSVMIGHSFGGRILDMVSSNQAGAQTGDLNKFRPIADLVVLINPASESLNLRQTKLSLQGWERDYPLTIVIGARNDFPNKRVWSLGYWLSRQPRTRDYHIPVPNGKPLIEKQRTFLTRTVANDRRQITHLLKELDLSDPRLRGLPVPSSPEEAFAMNLQKPEKLKNPSDKNDRILWLRTAEDPKNIRPFLFSHRDPDTVQGTDYVYDSKACWIFQVPLNILSGHSGDRKADHGGVLALSMTDLMAALFSSAALEQSRVLTARETAPSSENAESPKAQLTLQGKSSKL